MKTKFKSVRPVKVTHERGTSTTIIERIDKNRDEIDKWLNGDYPLGLVYMRIRMLSAQNERLISQLKAV